MTKLVDSHRVLHLTNGVERICRYCGREDTRDYGHAFVERRSTYQDFVGRASKLFATKPTFYKSCKTVTPSDRLFVNGERSYGNGNREKVLS